MSISASEIAKLRAQTGAGMMDCKNAMEESNGDFDKAIDWLRTRGTVKVAKRAGKIAAEGKVFTYLHGAGKIGVMLELNSETDFVAKNENFLALGNDIAMHIAAMNPKYLSREEVSKEDLEREKDVYRVQLQNENKPAEMIEKILEGKINKYYSEVCLLEQAFIKDEDKTIEQLLTATSGSIGEKISLRRFARFEVGEGIEKKVTDFVAEVNEQLGA
ncbi:MAG: elongation factor Ts [Candidatus Magasanikbacteria bacterium CG_4_10_14_0_8_um_filter_32_14]|uniref:Elongation factor Ts n=2 Tax=Candidatus Magasanikiibacteriota TaxID=1752731 RepID=A0A2M7RA13_9BACT|nr:MAG: elongation factor Ts [Candidatus Magasanikbacteria bacterium CG1_02_32_51]PIY93484.1 MAG: elongation factor Ts [Candidatus Magasanikbacteria bacterium CG_4_10_14_0_8_um_filter_32_14]